MIIDEAAYLAHYGVKGMKWGVRRKTAANRRVDKEEQRRFAVGLRAKNDGSGLSRRERGHIYVLDKRIAEAKKVRDHESLKLKLNTLPERLIFGEQFFQNSQNAKIRNAENAQARIRAGERTLMDKLDAAMNVPLATLYFERG